MKLARRITTGIKFLCLTAVSIFAVSIFGCNNPNRHIVYNPYVSTDEAAEENETSFDERVEAMLQTLQSWNESQLEPHYKYVYLQKVHDTDQVGDSEFTQVNIAIGISNSGYRKVLAVDWSNKILGWTPTFETMTRRGVTKVDLFIAGEQYGINSNIACFLPQSRWQRCLVHWKSKVQYSTPGNHRLSVDNMIHAFVHARSLPQAKLAHGKMVEQLDLLGLRTAKVMATSTYDHLFQFHQFPETHHSILGSNHPILLTLQHMRTAMSEGRVEGSEDAFIAELMTNLKELEETAWSTRPYIRTNQSETGRVASR